jgi:type VI secretion system protein ImpG
MGNAPMDKWLPYYERELAAVQEGARAFAERYPTIAAALRLSDEGSGDPHVERLIQSVAFLTARVAKRLDDDYAGFAEKLLDAVYPHYRRPMPACAIARFEAMTTPDILPARTPFRAGTTQRDACRFETVFPVRTGDPDIAAVAFRPAGTFRTTSGDFRTGPSLSVTWQRTGHTGSRVFVDGDPSVAAALRDALGLGVTAVLAPVPGEPGVFYEGGSLAPVGLGAEDCVLHDPATTHPGFHLLRELFAFPEKFGFFDLTLPPTAGTEVEQVILLLDAGVIGDGRMLATVGAANLLTRCAPVVNLFRDSAGHTARHHATAATRVYPPQDGRRGAELVAIESVAVKFDGEQGPHTELPHFFAVRPDVPLSGGPFWVAMQDAEDEGTENVMFLNRSFEAVPLGHGFSVGLLCCDGDRPARIVCGTAMADLIPSAAATMPRGRLITRPTAMSRFPLGKQASWRLVTHLALSQHSLLEGNGHVLRQVMHLYAPSGSLWVAQVTRALVGVRQRAITRWLPGAFPPTLVRGTAIEIAIDETHLVGVGLHALVRVLDVFFSLYAQMNSFTQLIIASSHTGKELHTCPLRTGTGPLI